MVRKNLPLLSSFLRFDRKYSGLSPPLITKGGSTPDIYIIVDLFFNLDFVLNEVASNGLEIVPF